MASADNCTAGWCATDDYCTITCTAALLSRKWHPVIVHRLLEHGPLGFNALQDVVGDVASNVLSDDLDRLQAHEIVDRRVVNEKPVRVEYELTERGQALEPIIEAMDEWGAQYLLGDGETVDA